MGREPYCVYCGDANGKHKRNCPTIAGTDREVQANYDRARELFDKFADELAKGDDPQVSDAHAAIAHDAAGALMLAISRANDLFPNAHALLGFCLAFGLSEPRKAVDEFRKALGQDRDNFRATAGQVMLGFSGLHGARSKDISWLMSGGGWSGLLFGLAGMGVVNAGVNMSKAQLMSALGELQRTYRVATRREADTAEWLNMADIMLDVGDMVEQQMKGDRRRPNLYAEVVNAPWNEIDLGDRAKEGEEIRDKARGRALLRENVSRGFRWW